ncbi:predicted protein [Plenodomus lingam JN3]|uniref:Predicted protein n=1 Tax=Leptosphaeria maculans (strain JN3 / isolate v23.1.3 / race Av1-4-5-6-7-8) TaxID=985895 RepID=E5AD01_LEPMJ|nr:predicted protein [Plenodomus lingam JN3]CBY02353.1 predicted protein [Plenodomus lingam JN3]
MAILLIDAAVSITSKFAEIIGPVISDVADVADVAVFIIKTVGGIAKSLIFFAKYYGPPGLILYLFGSRGMWQLQAQILCSPEERHVMDFKTSVQADSNIIAVAATILAQIAITALSLEDLSRTHWVARGAFTFSLLSAIMAVYYATNQYRKLGRCLQPEQVRAWIRGRKHSDPPRSETSQRNIDRDVLPSPASVLTVSAPNMLLSASLNSFLIGLGVYLGQVWMRNLDEVAGAHDSRAIFITYIIGLCVCYSIFGLSNLVVADQNYLSEREMLQDLRNTYPTTGYTHERRHAETSQNSHVSQGPVPGNLTLIVDADVEATGDPHKSTFDTSEPLYGQKSGGLDEVDRQELGHALRDLVAVRRQATKFDERMVRIVAKMVQTLEET